MARTNAQKRSQALRAGRERTSRRRKRMNEIGRPDTVLCDNALVEALAFTLAKVGLEKAGQSDLISGREVLRTAKTILVRRKGFNPIETAKALSLRAKVRTQHLDPSFIPSLQPDIEAQNARAGQTTKH